MKQQRGLIHEECGTKITITGVWGNVMICPHCGAQVGVHEVAAKTQDGRILCLLPSVGHQKGESRPQGGR